MVAVVETLAVREALDKLIAVNRAQLEEQKLTNQLLADQARRAVESTGR